MTENYTPSLRPLAGKLAVVTGSSRGIGAAIARNLAVKGADIAINHSSAGSKGLAVDLANDLSSKHSIKAIVFEADLSRPEGPANFIKDIVSAFSKGQKSLQIDIVVNNAGVSRNIPISGTSIEEFDAHYYANVRGPLLLMKAAQPYLPKDRSGRIVNVSSMSSQGGLEHQSIYGGTKAALEAMTRTWARELAENATVNAVNPGPVGTRMFDSTSDEFRGSMQGWMLNTPLGAARSDDGAVLKKYTKEYGTRPGLDYEIAGIVGMLCGSESGWCTGSVVCANGGMFMTS